MKRIIVVLALLLPMLFLVPAGANAANPRHAEFRGTVKGFGHGVCKIFKNIGQRDARVRCKDGYRQILKPCKDEGAGSKNCYWHAASRGDGQGRSFIDRKGKTYYIRIISEGQVGRIR